MHQLFHFRVRIGHLNKQRRTIGHFEPLQRPAFTAAAAAAVVIAVAADAIVVVRVVEAADGRNAHGGRTVR